MDVTSSWKFNNTVSRSDGSSFIVSENVFSAGNKTIPLNIRYWAFLSLCMFSVCTDVRQENQKITTETTA